MVKTAVLARRFGPIRLLQPVGSEVVEEVEDQERVVVEVWGKEVFPLTRFPGSYLRCLTVGGVESFAGFYSYVSKLLLLAVPNLNGLFWRRTGPQFKE